jgi:hypothetical protein
MPRYERSAGGRSSSPPSDVCEHTVERARHAAEIERHYKRCCKSDLPFESAAEVALFSCVAETGQPDVGFIRSVEP